MTLGRITRRRSAGNRLMFLRLETSDPLSNTPVSIQVQLNSKHMQSEDADPHRIAVRSFEQKTSRGDWIGMVPS